MKLTDRSFATGVTVNDLIHIVITGDTTQSPQGSSFKASIGQITSLLNQSQEFYFDVTIPSSDVLTLNTIPVELVPTPGANKIIIPTQIIGEIDYNSVAYATNGIVSVFNGGSYGVARVNANAFLFSTVSRIVNIQKSLATIVTDTQYVANSPLTLQVESANPTAGDSDIRILGWYKVVTI